MSTRPRRPAPDQHTITLTTTQVLAGMVRRPAESLSPDTRLFLDLGLTSVNAVELVMRLEDELTLDLQAGTLDWQSLETLGALTAYVIERAGQ